MKKAFSILTGLALLLVLLTSCEKNPETGSNNGISDAGAITGVVKDVETGKTLSNKFITLSTSAGTSLKLSTKTDAEGRFLFGHIPPSLDYFIYSVFDEEYYYDVVYLSVDGKVRNLTGIDDEDDANETIYYKDKYHYFSIKAGQIREVEIRVKKDIYEEED